MIIKAEDSHQVQKARRKLEKKFEAENKLIDDKAIAQMKKAIRSWIHRHGSERVALPERVGLFDKNRHPVEPKIKFVNQLLKKLQKDASASQTGTPLAGRIKQ